jgi:hypothetical protein
MKITEEQLITIHNRVEQVFIAKTGYKPDSIKLASGGEFYCHHSWSVSYGGEEYVSETINADDLTMDLDEHIRIRKVKEEEERIEAAKRRAEATKKYEETQKKKRELEYEKLKKEFENK